VQQRADGRGPRRRHRFFAARQPRRIDACEETGRRRFDVAFDPRHLTGEEERGPAPDLARPGENQRPVDVGVPVDHAVAHELGPLEPGNELQHARLLALLQLGLEPDQAVVIGGQAVLAQLDDGSGVLVLTDMFGATPGNVAARLLADGRVEGVAGLSLPMLLRALAGRDGALAATVQRALSGGTEGVLYMNRDCCRDAKR